MWTCVQQNTTSSIADDHSYAVQSPTKLKAQNDLLIGKLAEKNARIRNLRKREVTKATKIEQLTSELKEHALLTEAANNSHMAETVEGIDNHVYSLVRQIVRFYLVIRSNHYVQSFNTETRVSVRQTLNKLVLFKNQ